MKRHIAREDILYDGGQISSNWAYRVFGLEGDSIVAFQGECRIPFEKMIDIEDVKSRSAIYSKRMLHLIVEVFEHDLGRIILLQRLLAVIVKEELERRIGRSLSREGDDLYDGDSKLTISVATLTPVSSKIHFGINIIAEGAPVDAKGLHDYGVTTEDFAGAVLERFTGEIEDIGKKKSHVRGAE